MPYYSRITVFSIIFTTDYSPNYSGIIDTPLTIGTCTTRITYEANISFAVFALCFIALQASDVLVKVLILSCVSWPVCL